MGMTRVKLDSAFRTTVVVENRAWSSWSGDSRTKACIVPPNWSNNTNVSKAQGNSAIKAFLNLLSNNTWIDSYIQNVQTDNPKKPTDAQQTRKSVKLYFHAVAVYVKSQALFLEFAPILQSMHIKVCRKLPKRHIRMQKRCRSSRPRRHARHFFSGYL